MVVIEVRVDPQEKDLNVVEGIISLQDIDSNDISSVVVETGGSILTLWTVPPKYSSEEKVIRFVGGAPDGFDYESPLFRMRIFTKSSGNAKISWLGGAAYLNDGKGTKENISARSIDIAFIKSNMNIINKLSFDNTPPDFDNIEIGRDPSVYDGKYFISFNATDNISGIERYEVREGQESTVVLDGVYVLKNQDREESITITAYDQVGNSRTIEFPSRFDWIKDVIIILSFVIVLFFIFKYAYKKFSKK